MSRMPFPAFLLAAVGALLCGGARSAGASAADDLTAATGAGQSVRAQSRPMPSANSLRLVAHSPSSA